MSLIQESLHAAECLEHLQGLLREKGDHNRDEEISSIICLLESPLLHQLLVLQDSIQELQQVNESYTIGKDDFDFLSSGELVLRQQNQEPTNIHHSLAEVGHSTMQTLPIATSGYNQEIQRFAEKAARGREMETIELFKPENSSLGFSVVGLKTDSGEMGIFVKDIQPNGIALRDGRLREKDQILVIDGQPLDISHQEAIRILQSARGLVELIVARGLFPPSTPDQPRQEVQEPETTPPQQESSDMVLNTEWTQIEEIELINDGTGLGFGIIGGRSTGVVVKTILPGGVADSDGRLRSGDHILQIGDVNVRAMGSEQVAAVLRQAGSHVRLIVARPVIDDPSLMPLTQAPIVPTLRLDEHLQRLNNLNVDGSDSALNGPNIPEDTAVISMASAMTTSLVPGMLEHNAQIHPVPVPPPYDGPSEYPEVEYFDVELGKDLRQGLGITIAGYVGRDNTPDDLCGIFVKSIAEGSAADLNGRIQVNDQIIEVDGQSLHGYTNHQAVEVLRKTGQVVKLKLVRYQHGAKFERLQLYLCITRNVDPDLPAHNAPSYQGLHIIPQPQLLEHDATEKLTQPPLGQQQPNLPTTQVFTSVEMPTALPPPPYEPSIQEPQRQVNIEDVNVMSMEEDFDGELSPDMEAAIRMGWEPIVGDDFEVVVAQLSKFKEGGGLGISLEGTVDVENGVEVRPHHYIRSILPNGPVGVNKRLRSGDELLEVNGKRLLGLNHKEVVGILKDLPQYVRLVCARRKMPASEIYAPPETPYFPSDFNVGVVESPLMLTKAKSEMDIPTSEPTVRLDKRSRSLEPLTGLAMWSTEPVVIELNKGDKGLGFSILDYQDPANPSETVIVIRSLVPGGVAQQDGRLVPGDRLIFVNDANLETATLDEAVQTLKGAPKGLVQIGVAKPLPLSEAFQDQSNNNSLESQIAAFNTFSSQIAAPLSLHEHAVASHSYINAESTPLMASLTRKESMSSASTTSDDLDKPFSKKSSLERRDSFYESDEEDLSYKPSPVKSPSSASSSSSKSTPPSKKPVKPKKPKATPRKQDSQVSVTSYENEEIIQTFLAQEQQEKLLAAARSLEIDHKFIVAKKQREAEENTVQKEGVAMVSAQPGVSQDEYDYKNSVLSQTTAKEPDADTKQHRAELSEIVDYENNTLGPLPSYEEAVSGDLEMPSEPEFFDLDELEDAPPVPVREDSNQLPPEVGYQEELSSPKLSNVSSEEQTIKPSPREPPVTKKRVTVKKAPPPVPPKPAHLIGSPGKGKDEPPPLPMSSPPPLLPTEEEVKTPPIVSSSQRMNESWDSSFSSVSDHFTTSDLKAASSPSSTPRTASPGISPLSSPSLMRSLSGGADVLPSTLEKVIKLKKSHDQLGLSVEAAEKGVNGCIVTNIAKNGAIAKEGSIQVGDYITFVNNESLRRVTNAQARAILRRASLMGSIDMSISYIPSADAAVYRETASTSAPEYSPMKTMMPSPKIFPKYYRSTLSPLLKRESSSTDGGSTPSSPARRVPGSEDGTPQSSPQHRPSSSSPQSVQTSEGTQTWGPPRTVELLREPGKSLGISIVGGKVDIFRMSKENTISGIFIKHVLEDSPAGRNGTLKTGDRILEVDAKDLRNATHDQAVEIIRNAKSPVIFVVQSLGDPGCPRDSDIDRRSVQSYDEAPSQRNTWIAPSHTQETEGTTTAEEQEEVVDEYGYSMERIQRQYGGDLSEGELHLVEFLRGNGGLGLSLAGNKDRSKMSVFVAGIQPNSIADRDGQIQVGDELLEVNGNVLVGRSHLNASSIIKGLQTPTVKIVLRRRPDFIEHMAVKPLTVSPSLLKNEKSGSGTEPITISTKSEGKSQGSSPISMHDVIQVIDLNKGPAGLGFAIVEETKEGCQGIYVRSITIGGVASQNGNLSVGDQILEVADKPLNGVPYDKAIEILRNAQGTVRLKVRKVGADNSLNDSSSQQNVQLSNFPGESSTDPPTESGANQAPDDGSADTLTCPVIPGKETVIEIEKGRTGLGLSIVGGADTLLGAIIIHEVYEDGAAAKDGRLWAGDQVLEVGDENLREATHDYAIQVLRQTPSRVRIVVFRDDTQVKDEDIYDIFTVELLKKPGKGLGLSIVGKRNDVGVYISDIVKGGVAEADGRLMQGDQILSVNGEDMKSATQEYAAAVLKTLQKKVTLTVGRLKAGSKASSRRNSNSPGTALKKSESSASNKSRGGRHSKSVSEDASHIRTVELTFDSSGSLGLSIAGGIGSSLGDTPVMVANMDPTGPAAKSQKLKIGDKIISINGVSTEGLRHEHVIKILKSASGGTVTLQVTQGEQTPVSISGRSSRQVSMDLTPELLTPTPQDSVFDNEDDGPPPTCKTIVLERGPEGLGFSIVGGHGSPHGDLPIYVKNVFSKGAAAENGQLKRGDQILSVNGQSLEGCTHEEAVNILKNAKGTVTLNVLS